MNTIKQQSGFTLIELSIVLVIIGLVVGGVLVGQDLINAAKVRQSISEMERVDTAAHTFRTKYNCVSGDCTNATLFFASGTQPDQTTNGDGNRVIDARTTTDTDGYYPTTDRARFFDHLANAGLIELPTFDETSVIMPTVGEGVVYPAAPVGNGFVAYNFISAGYHAYILGVRAATGSPGIATYDQISFGNGIVRSFDAFQIDSKIDDGAPLTGTVVALRPSSYFDVEVTYRLQSAAAPGSGSCVSNAAGNPYSTDSADFCALSIRASF